MQPDLITPQCQRLQADFGLTAVVASEIEFYLHGAGACNSMPAFWEKVAAGVRLVKHEKEKGGEQYEAALFPSHALQCARDTAALVTLTSEIAVQFSLRADFSPKPLPDEPGSGLHIHVHLQDALGKNVFFKNDDDISDALKHSIGGLLKWLPASMPIFAPHEESYARFTEKTNAPTTVSWGANNRTVAIRLPDAAHDNKRIEHRVAGPDADPHQVIAIILAAIHYGLMNRCDPGAQIYGDAALPMYDLPKLPNTLAEARKHMAAFAPIGEPLAL